MIIRVVQADANFEEVGVIGHEALLEAHVYAAMAHVGDKTPAIGKRVTGFCTATPIAAVIVSVYFERG